VGVSTARPRAFAGLSLGRGWAGGQTDPAWKDNILFNEYFHGDNGAGLGASHQTGWTGVVADLILRSRGSHVATLGELISGAAQR
jgi:hypothetical protein